MNVCEGVCTTGALLLLLNLWAFGVCMGRRGRLALLGPCMVLVCMRAGAGPVSFPCGGDAVWASVEQVAVRGVKVCIKKSV